MILWFVRNLRPVYRSVRFRNFPGTLASRPVPGIWPVWGTGCPDRNPERCDRQLSTSERDFPDPGVPQLSDGSGHGIGALSWKYRQGPLGTPCV